jgi:hypothetical protein
LASSRSAWNRRTLVEIADGADAVVAVSHNQRQTSRHVASNKQNRRERLALVDLFEVVVYAWFVAREKRKLGPAQKVFRRMVD